MKSKRSIGARTLVVVVLAAAGVGGIAAAAETGDDGRASGGPSRSADVARDTLAGSDSAQR